MVECGVSISMESLIECELQPPLSKNLRGSGNICGDNGHTVLQIVIFLQTDVAGGRKLEKRVGESLSSDGRTGVGAAGVLGEGYCQMGGDGDEG